MTKDELSRIITKVTEAHDEILKLDTSSNKSYLLSISWNMLSELQRIYELIESEEKMLVSKFWESLD